MKHTLILYACTLIVMTLLDLLWIGGIARDFYRSRIGNLEFHPAPAVAFYLMYAAGIVVFVNGGAGARWPSTLLYGALFGLFAYATYDLTNLATLKGWSPLLAVVDMAWGMFVTAAGATAGLLIAGFF
jgi:uncharacterized membrane protein